MKIICTHCHRRKATNKNGQCSKCNAYQNACKRCANAEALDGFGRCEPCLNYAANWQHNKTLIARGNHECVICGQETLNFRCAKHSNYRKKAA